MVWLGCSFSRHSHALTEGGGAGAVYGSQVLEGRDWRLPKALAMASNLFSGKPQQSSSVMFRVSEIKDPQKERDMPDVPSIMSSSWH